MLKPLALALLLFAALAYGLTQLFLLRFQTGEVHPPYSSLRADPLGAKAFHDALAELPRLDVQRNYRRIEKVQPAEPITLLYAGTPAQAFWREEELRHVEGLAITGSRVVITFLPERAPSDREIERTAKHEKQRKEEREKKKQPPKADESKAGKEDDKKEDEEVDLSLVTFGEVAKRWGFEFAHLPRASSTAPRRARLQLPDVSAEPDIAWHTTLYFAKPQDKWRTLYACEKRPVIIERKFGAGSLVLAADSYFLSNEALRKEPAPQLLAWLAGPARTVVFDEESHGVSENPGIATMARRYGLHGVAAGLLVIAALFIWKNASRFLPPRDDPDSTAEVAGREASEGLVNLLRRSVPPAQLLAVCADEWRKTCDPRGESLHSAHLEKVLAAELARPARERNPVAAYATIRHILSKTK